MSSGELFSMAELVRRTGLHPATIRHYLRLGLAPAPQRQASNRFLYDRRHEQVLSLVKLLRQRRDMSLPEIGRVLPRLTRMSADQAFQPEMWDRVAGAGQGKARSCTPSERLLAAGLQAFTDRCMAEVSVDDLCRSAGVAKGSFYLHYRSKEDLYFAVVGAAGTEVAVAFARDAGPVPLTPDRATSLLSSALVARLPLFLDLLALAAQRRGDHARAAQELFAKLGSALGPRLVPPRDQGVVRRALGEALGEAIGQTVGLADGGA